jgi:predicted DNA-binding transcriptional regulator AlpA
MNDVAERPAITPPVDRIIFRPELCEMCNVSSESIRRWIKMGRIPPADVHITRRTTGWRLSTLLSAGIRLI